MKAKVVLLLALIMAIITTALFFQYMKSVKVTTTVETDSLPPTVEIVVAAKQIQKNERISSEKVKLVKVDEKGVHPNAARKLDEVVNKLATATIYEEEQILSKRLINEREETLYVSRKIREGYRAVSVGVNINQSVTNLIEPEDEVDVIFTKVKKVGDVDKATSEVILKNARVLAVGRKMIVPEDTKKEEYVEYSSLTIELKPEDAVLLIRSSHEGTLNFILNQRPTENNRE
jgi:pilus assembly protein CpaB